VVQFSNGPAQPPKPWVGVLVQVAGRGNVRAIGRRALAAGVPPLNCGTTKLDCLVPTTSGAHMTLRAEPSDGYEFAGWTGGCSGDAVTCVVQAMGQESIEAHFVPTGKLRRVSLRVNSMRLSVRWLRSVGSGTLLARGAVSARARLRLELRRPHGGPLLTRTRVFRRGAFAFRRALRNGRLLRGAHLFPGGFVVVVRGQSGTLHLPLQVRTLRLPGPREGVVLRTHISATRDGPALKTVPVGSKRAWATFRFAAQPRTGPIIARWYRSNGELLGQIALTNRRTVRTGIGADGGLGASVWRIDLLAGGKLVKRMRLQIG